MTSRFTSAAVLENQRASEPTATTFQPASIEGLRVVDVIGKNQPHDRHFAAFPQDQSHAVLDLLGVDVEAAGERHGEVVRPDADHVHAIERQDLVKPKASAPLVSI